MATAQQTPRTDLDWDVIKNAIATERERLQDQLRRIREQDRSGSQGAETSELADYDQHEADQGTELYFREADEALYVQFRNELEALNVAERRIQEGTYGYCERCSKPISGDRLEMLPFTPLCIGCAQELEGR